MKNEPHTWMNDDTARFIITVLLILLVAFIIGCLLLIEIPPTNKEILYGLAGTVVGALVGSVNFYNKTGVTNDRQKDDTINKAMTAVATAQAVANPDVNAIPVADGESKTIVGTGNVDSSGKVL